MGKTIEARLTRAPGVRGRPCISGLRALIFAVMLGVAVSGCAPQDAPPVAPAAPVVKTDVPGGALVVPANLPPEQQAQIRAQEQATLDSNRQHAAPASGK